MDLNVKSESPSPRTGPLWPGFLKKFYGADPHGASFIVARDVELSLYLGRFKDMRHENR